MGRTTKLITASVVLLGAASATVILISTRSDKPAAAIAATQPLATETVTQMDLTTYEETTATLGFTTSIDVASPVAGTVTSIVAPGETIDAGSVVATLDGNPVVALVGDVPGYRDLSTDSDAGADVRQLETNLVALGYDPESAIVIDETYDEATAAAVDLWEAELGLDADGEVPESQIVYVPGRLLVDTVQASVGSAATSGSTLLSARQSQRSFPVSATVGDSGIVDGLADVGTPVTTGTVLFWDNGWPVVAIEGDPAALPALDRDLSLGVDDGADVKVLEQMLAAGGYDPSSAMTIDDHYDQATVFAVAVWLQSLGWTIDGEPVVPAGGFVTVPSGLFVGEAEVANGTTLAGDAVVMSLTSAAREVTTTAPIGDDTFALGATIDVIFPDATVQPGTVVDVGTVATNSSGVPGETPSVTITIHVEDIPSSVDSFVQIPVTLRVVDESIPDAFVVPVSALVALAEGGYALEVVGGENPDGTTATTLIPVEPGLFTDGFVSVSGDQVSAGLPVVVPS